jgi:hypothetical protein
MNARQDDRLSAWARLFEALGNVTSKVVWSLVAVVILAALGRYLYIAEPGARPSARPERRTTVSVQPPVPWHEVDHAMVEAFRTAHKVAEDVATTKIQAWAQVLEQRLDDDFLAWYFSYFQQQWLGLKAIGYWTAERLLHEQPTMAEQITADIQEEFAKRILRPEIAQMQLERITHETITEYLRALQHNIAPIPDRYNIPQADWDGYLATIATLIARSEGNRQIPLSLKLFTSGVVVGGIASAATLSEVLKPVFARIGTKVSTTVATEGAGQAAATMAARTGAKVGVRAGGRLLGVIIGIGVLAWDIWDHQHTERVERPILRANLIEYLAELQHALLRDPETGIMTMIDAVEHTMVSALRSSKAS